MGITIGQHIGLFEITALLGKGGMGEVYRARDSRLERDVAIKTLPEEFETDADRLTRFDREAKVLASLNHPNIGAIYGIEKHDARHFLVLELVEGQTLADLIARGPIPVDESLKLAQQIAEALQAAHDKGVIHRDLKPANIKITHDGVVKVLDFGLAKATDVESAEQDAGANSPTLRTLASTPGLILGTAAYMSPEQAKGRPVDRRTDIFAFGCVLYEMLTGRRAFEGEDVSDTLAALLRAEPDWSALPQDVPRGLQTLIQRCLAKDRTKRVGEISSLKFVLSEPAFVGSANGSGIASISAPSRSRSRMGFFVLAVMAMAAAIALTILAVVHFREAPADERTFHLSVSLPNENRPGFLQLSPDGRRLLVVLYTANGSQIYLRSRESAELVPLPGTNYARTPFWSPDSRLIAFFADGKLKLIPAAGGPTQDLCAETGLGRGGTWNRDGVILFATATGSLMRVNASGGDCRPLEKAGKQDWPAPPGMPAFLPDGNHYMFVSSAGSRPGIYLAALNGDGPRRILSDISSVVYVPRGNRADHSYVLFLRDQTLMAQPFDEANLQTVSDPFSVVTGVAYTPQPPEIAASVAMDGTLAYVTGNSPNTQLTWVDQSGTKVGTVGPVGLNVGVSISPDGKFVVTARQGQNPGVWLYDLERGSENRLIATSSVPAPLAVAWSSDSQRILLTAPGPAGPGLYAKSISGGEPELLDQSPVWSQRRLSDWSRDGSVLLYSEVDPKTQGDIWYQPMNSGKPAGQPVKVLATDAVESHGQLSPDGKWLAYASTESGGPEVYVRPFPSGSGIWKVSVDGGREPRWSADGKSLYFMGRINSARLGFVTARVHADGRGTFKAETPQLLFQAPVTPRVPQANAFTFSPDGQRFLVNMHTDSLDPIVNVVTNAYKWIADRQSERSRTN
jgi:serine/threonine protein kinase